MKENFKSPFWILGKSISGITSIEWIGTSLESFANCGTLIVDLTTLSNEVLSHITTERMNDLSNEIQKRFSAGGDIICILQKTSNVKREQEYAYNYFWSPLTFSITPINRGKGMKRDSSCDLTEYLDKIKFWSFKIDPYSSPTIHGQISNDNSEILGGLYSVKTPGGKFLALPPLDDASESLGALLESLNLFEKTPPPDWINKINISKINELNNYIIPINNKINKLEKEKKEYQRQIEDLQNYKKILYCKSVELEESVKNALDYLDLSNVRFGEPGKDDLLFDFNSTEFQLCSIEVKGREKNGKLDDLRELDNWVTDHMNVETRAKGVLIANIYRLEDLSSSKSKRMDFSNFEQYYKPRNYCVLPTVTLFELVKHKLEGNNIPVNKIEETIANSNGILTLEDFIK